MDTKLIIFGMLSAVLIIFVYPVFSAQCSFQTSESACEANNCFWCEGCVNNMLGNGLGGDKCVPSSLDCTYSCSMQCGAQCQTSANCQGNITDNTCYYDGKCSACSCIYKQDLCPKNGTIINDEIRTCYYSTRACGTNGCSVQSCVMSEGQICHPDDGCKQGNAQEEYLTDYSCKNNELHADLITYYCNATECSYSKTDTLVERCENGCVPIDAGGVSQSAKCNEELCDIYGVKRLCSRQDGFYGDRYCAGNDIYQSYRTYGCGTNECVPNDEARKISSCNNETTPSASGSTCYNGNCVEPKHEQVVYTDYILPQPEETETPRELTTVMHVGGRLYNGFLFGSNQIIIPSSGSGQINFTIRQTNRLGALVVEADKRIIFEGNAAPDTYSVPFTASRTITIYTRSSGWFFFTPAAYDVRNIVISFV